MGRFLISTLAEAGHVHPAVPVAAALTARGHEVLWHTGAEFAATVERAGAHFVLPRHTPTLAELPVTPDPGTSGAAAGASLLRRLLVERMAGQLADYEEILAAEDVDGVLVDLCCLGGLALHERRGTPWATLGISPLTITSPDTPPFGTGWKPPAGPLGRARNRIVHRLGRIAMRSVTVAYADQRAALGLAPLARGVALFDHMFSPMLHLQAATPSIEYPRRSWPANVHLVGPLLPEPPAAADLPPWWGELDTAPAVVHVTQGTFATDPATLIDPALDALARFDGLVVVTTPDPAALAPVPANTRVARFVPHSLLLPHVDAMVTNGGYNGAKAALACGVPLVLAPWGNDQMDVAARVEWAGAGINLREAGPAPEAIAGAVRAVLGEPGYLRAARRVQAEFREYGGGERAAVLLERLTATSGVVSGR